MVCQPGASFQAVVTAEIVRDEENVPLGIVGFDVLEEFNVVPGIARSRAACDLLATAAAQCPIDPDFLLTTTVLYLERVRYGIGPGRSMAGGRTDHSLSLG